MGFIQKERVELRPYITPLFDHYKTRINEENTIAKRRRKTSIVQLS